MSKETSHTDRAIRQELQSFVQDLLNDGFGASEISFCLAEAAASVGLDLAPDSEIAISVVLEGIQVACTARSPAMQNQNEHRDVEHGAPAHATLH